MLWDPIAESPVIKLPGQMSPKWVGAEVVHQKNGELIVLAHLNKRDPKDQRYNSQWQRFWKNLSYGERNRTWTLSLLERWKKMATDAPAGALTEEQDRARRNFLNNITGALARVAKYSAEPMAWAGPEFSKYPSELLDIIEVLTVGIDEFLEGNIDEEGLARVLKSQKLHPRTSGLPVPESARKEVRGYAEG
ncbi:hypothetical protein [Mycobacteroides abscessus]|uniref:hypothetical protein n=1 Tax=Mycobacteroides abscessus TaxID=36809 RepID=UPI0009A7E320|nr:hypothetical protein [Mycobacteroides abscessus]